jgi:hypothetical protein
MLGVVGLDRGGSKSESSSEGGAGGLSCVDSFGVELFGTRDNRARRRAAGVSAAAAIGGELDGEIEDIRDILGVDCASGSSSSSIFSRSSFRLMAMGKRGGRAGGKLETPSSSCM